VNRQQILSLLTIVIDKGSVRAMRTTGDPTLVLLIKVACH
jgi:hypothetical protein